MLFRSMNSPPPTSERFDFPFSTRCRAVSTPQKGYGPHCVYFYHLNSHITLVHDLFTTGLPPSSYRAPAHSPPPHPPSKAASAKKTRCSAHADQDSWPLTKLRGRVSTDPPNRRSSDGALWTTGWMVSHRRWSRTTRWSR